MSSLYEECMVNNAEYYERNALKFFEDTVRVEMSPLHERFLAGIPPGGRILDAGCGSGRDSKRFAELGYRVAAFDASPAMANLATEHCGSDVSVRTFAEIDEDSAYDGIVLRKPLTRTTCRNGEDALEIVDRFAPRRPLVCELQTWKR